MMILALTIMIVAVAMAALALGLFFNRKTLRGSCRGVGQGFVDAEGTPLTCASCACAGDNETVDAPRPGRGA